MDDHNDFLSELLSPAAPIPRELKFGGKTGTAYFRRVTAGERAQLLAGQKFTKRGDEATTIDIDLGETTKGKARMVAFACVTEKGKQRFNSVADVQKVDALLVEALYELASDVNKEADEDGKDEAGKN